MEQLPSWLPNDVDRPDPAPPDATTTSHELAVDRNLARGGAEAVPSIPEIARHNRALLRRAVRYCLSRDEPEDSIVCGAVGREV